MACKEKEEMINRLLDGELSEAQTAEIKEHMAGCHSCKTYYSMLQLLQKAFEEGVEEEAPEGFAERVMEKARNLKRPKRSVSFRFPFTAAAAVIVLAVFAFQQGALRQNNLTSSDVIPEASTSAAPEDAAGTTAGTVSGGASAAGEDDVLYSAAKNDGGSTLRQAPSEDESQNQETQAPAETPSFGAAKSVPSTGQTSDSEQGGGTVAPQTANQGIKSFAVKAVVPSEPVEKDKTVASSPDLAPLGEIESAAFAYTVASDDGTYAEKLKEVKPAAQTDAYAYYRLSKEQWDALEFDVLALKPLDGVALDDAAEYGIFVLPMK